MCVVCEQMDRLSGLTPALGGLVCVHLRPVDRVHLSWCSVTLARMGAHPTVKKLCEVAPAVAARGALVTCNSRHDPAYGELMDVIASAKRGHVYTCLRRYECTTDVRIDIHASTTLAYIGQLCVIGNIDYVVCAKLALDDAGDILYALIWNASGDQSAMYRINLKRSDDSSCGGGADDIATGLPKAVKFSLPVGLLHHDSSPDVCHWSVAEQLLYTVAQTTNLDLLHIKALDSTGRLDHEWVCSGYLACAIWAGELTCGEHMARTEEEEEEEKAKKEIALSEHGVKSITATVMGRSVPKAAFRHRRLPVVAMCVIPYEERTNHSYMLVNIYTIAGRLLRSHRLKQQQYHAAWIGGDGRYLYATVGGDVVFLFSLLDGDDHDDCCSGKEDNHTSIEQHTAKRMPAWCLPVGHSGHLVRGTTEGLCVPWGTGRVLCWCSTSQHNGIVLSWYE